MVIQQGIQPKMVLVVNCFLFFKLFYFCFVVCIFDLVHGKETKHGLF